ncbi:traB domain-containing protein-like isoform X2 [Macadamia integrifolia]|uniref:traB domain-containing protein-like isoform X2 n=1 Tax=Macadamia integrifolia TaxID=60698 RepID=UPI001C52E34D|nr:traB domain-containing protein-like isoform X2 [Macadamia integrifolia]
MEPDATAGVPDSDASLPEDFVHVKKMNLPEISVDEREALNSISELSQNPQPYFETSSRKIASVDDAIRDDLPAPIESQAPESTAMEVQGKKVLPEELAKGCVMLECESSAEGGSCDVYLVGTAHVSLESCREVQAIIGYLKPQVVFLELCSSRVAILTPQNLEVPTMKEMVDMWMKKNMNTFGIIYTWFLAKVAKKLEVFPGSEFRVAYEEAMQYGGKVILGDRPAQVTIQRTWGKMSLWHKAKFLYCTLFQSFFLPSPEDINKLLKEMDDVDMLTLVIQDMSKEFPTLMETLIFERDLYMSSTLLRVASEHASVVAVVGKGHLQGIKRHWKQPIDERVNSHEAYTSPANGGCI